MNKQNRAFTLVELIVVITILAILGTIAFISFQGYSAQARDSKRLSDIQNIKKSLELFSLNIGKYPEPDNSRDILYGIEEDIVRKQGTIGKQVTINLSRNLNKKPVDSLTGLEYKYSVINNQTQYELLSIYESDLVGSLISSTYAEAQDYPRIDGTYNGIYVKTKNYYIATPSIITSEEVLEGGLKLNGTNIKSQILTGGSNIPKIGIQKSGTGGLEINLSAYTGSIDSSNVETEGIKFIESIQKAYSGTVLANELVYQDLLAIDTTSNDEIKTYVKTVVLNSGNYASTETKKEIDTLTPEGGSYIITSNGTNEISETNSKSIILNITCPVEEGVEMYISGDVNETLDWEVCSTSKNLTLVTGEGERNINIKFKGSNGNETVNLNKKVTFVYTYSWNTGGRSSCSAGYSSWGSWSTCSKTCGTGYQYRSCLNNVSGNQSRIVECRRNDGISVNDSYCSGSKPSSSQICITGCSGSSSQTCNTHACPPVCYSASLTMHIPDSSCYGRSNCRCTATMPNSYSATSNVYSRHSSVQPSNCTGSRGYHYGTLYYNGTTMGHGNPSPCRCDVKATCNSNGTRTVTGWSR